MIYIAEAMDAKSAPLWYVVQDIPRTLAVADVRLRRPGGVPGAGLAGDDTHRQRLHHNCQCWARVCMTMYGAYTCGGWLHVTIERCSLNSCID